MRGALGLICLIALAAPRLAAAAPNPPHNFPLSDRERLCIHDSRRCQDAMIYFLDRAHARMGLPPYRLPADFLSLSGAQQIFVLANLDRLAYGLAPIAGLNTRLDKIAREGIAVGDDPRMKPSPAFPQQNDYGWTSNWAGGEAVLLNAYYDWMYDDGWGSFNLACTSPHAALCWGHRQDILWAPVEPPETPLQISMGAATEASHEGAFGYYTLIILATDTAISPRYFYTWEEAEQDGAGQHVYRVRPPRRH